MLKKFYFKKFNLALVHNLVLFKKQLYYKVQYSISMQFQCEKQFCFKQFSLSKVYSLLLSKNSPISSNLV